jgi:hypothetical protein
MKLNSVMKFHRGARLERIALAAALSASLAIACPLAASAVTITGSVNNGTTEKVSAGEPVTLIALGQGMQEVGHTKTDAAGRFSVDAPDSGMHLIRVDHQSVAYFQPVPPNTSSVNVQVFDVAPAVAGVGTEANVMRMETDAQGLRVVQNIFVKNGSAPPRTQFSNHSYEIYLPPGAQIEGSAAMGPGSMPVQSSPIPLAEKGLYAFSFPLRPGETQFQLSYHLPYPGSFSFTPRMATAVANFVVILPKSMTFKAGPGVSFQLLQEEVNAQTFLVRDVAAAQPLSFAVSGSGVMPRDSKAAGSQAGAGPDTAQGAAAPDSSSPSSSSTDTRPGIGLGNPIDTPDPLDKYKWWILGGLAVIFAIAAALFLRRPANEPTAPLASAQPVASAPIAAAATAFPGNVLLTALKEELFALESDRVQGRLSDADYGDLKSALELVLRRALSR